LEREHIRLIVQRSADHEYGPNEEAAAALDQELTKFRRMYARDQELTTQRRQLILNALGIDRGPGYEALLVFLCTEHRRLRRLYEAAGHVNDASCCLSERQRALLPKLASYRVRVAACLIDECVLCDNDIRRGEPFHDGGAARRAHASCVKAWS